MESSLNPFDCFNLLHGFLTKENHLFLIEISDLLNNQITIQTNPNDTTLNGQEIVVDLTIVYDTICLSWYK